jgi:hypothetical protein
MSTNKIVPKKKGDVVKTKTPTEIELDRITVLVGKIRNAFKERRKELYNVMDNDLNQSVNLIENAGKGIISILVDKISDQSNVNAEIDQIDNKYIQIIESLLNERNASGALTTINYNITSTREPVNDLLLKFRILEDDLSILSRNEPIANRRL